MCHKAPSFEMDSSLVLRILRAVEFQDIFLTLQGTTDLFPHCWSPNFLLVLSPNSLATTNPPSVSVDLFI